MIDNWPYFLSQAGLLVGAVFCLGIVHLTAQDPGSRKTALYFIAIWVFGSLCMYQFSKDAAVPLGYEEAKHVFLLRVGIGFMLSAVYFSYRYEIGPALSAGFVTRTNRVLFVASALVVAGSFAYALFLPPGTAHLETRLDKIEQQQQTDSSEVISLRSDNARMSAVIVTLNQRALSDSLFKISQQKQIAKLTNQVDKLVNLLPVLQRNVRQVGQAVERARSSPIVPVQPLKNTTPQNLLSPDRVKPVVPVEPGRRKRGPRNVSYYEAVDGWEGQPDSTLLYYVRHGEQ